MRALVLEGHAPIETAPLRAVDLETPEPGRGQLRMRVTACGVCRSNLHMIEGDWPGVPTQLPMIPGHEVVGVVDAIGAGVTGFAVGDRVGVQPLYSTCGTCEFCRSGREQLCRTKEITGETVQGGYAEAMISEAAHTHHVPDELDDAEAAPLFCPGITAYGSVLKARPAPGKTIAVFGLGGVGHVVLQMVRLFGADVIAVSRGANHLGVAKDLGAARVIDSSVEDPVAELTRTGGVDASIVFAPSQAVVAQALQATKPGGVVVLGVNAEIGSFAFADERTVVGSILGSREMMEEVLRLAAARKLQTVVERYPLEQANEVLLRLKRGEIPARAVLTV